MAACLMDLMLTLQLRGTGLRWGAAPTQALRVLLQPLPVSCVPARSVWPLHLGFRSYTQVPLAQIWGPEQKTEIKNQDYLSKVSSITEES